jgi:Tfp pilus assembly protein PilF
MALGNALRLDRKLGRAHVLLGHIYERNLLRDKAFDAYLRATRTDPSLLEGYTNLARMQLDRRQKRGARRTLERALKVSPECTDCRVLLGRLYIESRKYRRAVQALEQLVRADYQNNLAHFYLGQAYAGLGMIAKATAEYNALAMANDVERANALLKFIRKKSRP